MPLHIIHGSDPHLRREAFDRLRASLDRDGSITTNTATFDARKTSLPEVIAASNTLPFLGDSRLVVLEGALEQAARVRKGKGKQDAPVPLAQPLSTDSEEEAGASAEGDQPLLEEEPDPSQWAKLAEYVPAMPPSTTLVLIDGEVPATGLLKTLGPLGTVEKCSPPADKDLPAWITTRARSIGLKIDGPAVKLLASLIGSEEQTTRTKKLGHTAMIASELDKLLAYAAGEVVREADVRELVSRASEHKGWELSDATFKGEGARAARLLHELIEDGAPPQVLLATLAGRYRRTAIAKGMLESGEPGSAIMSRLNIKDNALRYVIDEAERISWGALRAAYARLIEAELDVKRGLMDHDTLPLELAVQELASGRSART
jgi:DNA polymerase-3 subunit delta